MTADGYLSGRIRSKLMSQKAVRVTCRNYPKQYFWNLDFVKLRAKLFGKFVSNKWYIKNEQLILWRSSFDFNFTQKPIFYTN